MNMNAKARGEADRKGYIGAWRSATDTRSQLGREGVRRFFDFVAKQIKADTGRESYRISAPHARLAG